RCRGRRRVIRRRGGLSSCAEVDAWPVTSNPRLTRISARIGRSGPAAPVRREEEDKSTRKNEPTGRRRTSPQGLGRTTIESDPGGPTPIARNSRKAPGHRSTVVAADQAAVPEIWGYGRYTRWTEPRRPSS